MVVVYLLVLFLFTVYSFALVDLNITLVNHPAWEVFRNFMINLGYYQRGWSTAIFLLFLGVLSFFNWYFWQGKHSAVKLAIMIAAVLLLSYPFLSHDFFNYLFDAKILTFYGKNPYLFKPLDFPNDPWLRFMHWTHTPYPYGPVFLLLILLPSYFSFGKLILAYLFFKLFFAVFYVLAVWALNKFDKKQALFFATSPLVIIEGLVNNHNDLIGVSLALLALFFWHKQKRRVKSIFLALCSLGIKYVTLFALPLVKKGRYTVWFSLGFWIVIFSYIYIRIGIHPWYLLNLLILLPFLKSYTQSFLVLGIGSLISYYPYLFFGGWDKEWKVDLKEQIILLTLIVFFLLLGLTNKIYRRS